MPEIKRINDQVGVAGQIGADDVAGLKAAGYTTIINNRPDGETPGQPAGADIETAARAAGLAYHHIPLGREGVSQEMVARTRAALESSDGPVLAYCRSGTRSTTLWALSQAGKAPATSIISAAASAGYDISHLAGHLGED